MNKLHFSNPENISFYAVLLFLVIAGLSACADPPEIKTPTVVGNRLNRDAFQAYARHDYREAFHLFQKALDRYKTVDNREKIARALYSICFAPSPGFTQIKWSDSFLLQLERFLSAVFT